MTLTPEQIADFERRAAAGEKPQHPGWRKDQWWDWVLMNVSVYRALYDEFDNGYGIVVDRDEDHFIEGGLHSLAAAQIAAEHLLMEATAPLWAETVKALTEAAAALREIQEADGFYCTEGFGNETHRIINTTDLAGIEAAAKKASKEA